MTTELTLIVLGSSVQVIGALLFAAVLFHFERRAGRNYLRFWIWSWLAFAVYTTGSTTCLLYTSPSPRDRTRSRMPSSA